MNNGGKSKIIWFLVSLAIILVGVIWAYNQGQISSVKAELKDHETTQMQTDKDVADRLARVEEKLDLLLKFVGINSTKK